MIDDDDKNGKMETKLKFYTQISWLDETFSWMTRAKEGKKGRQFWVKGNEHKNNSYVLSVFSESKADCCSEWFEVWFSIFFGTEIDEME